ncbi:MAG: hypothetical protein WB729_01825 [Candidatus Sulfotelmatobacter sp.]
MSKQFLRFVWEAYDLLQSEVLCDVDLSQATDDLERSITQLLEPRISRVMSGDEPFYVQHGPYEHETREPAPAQPPQYDIAFVLSANPRIMWPLEAKVLTTENAVSEYVKEVKDSFLSCRYAPFVPAAAMLGYLVGGSGSKTLRAIAKKLPCKMRQVGGFESRAHKYSSHERLVPKEKKYPKVFRCHHLIMPLS